MCIESCAQTIPIFGSETGRGRAESARIGEYLFRAEPRPTASGANSLRQVVTLLTLLQGEASTENALRASEQSKILAVFTVVTVLFVSRSLDSFMPSSKRHADRAGSSVVGDQPLRRRSPEFPFHLDYERHWSWIRHVYILSIFSYSKFVNSLQFEN